jgi:8-oxo-dGTP pyrophosphatase MutT (NUDIX family)
MEKIYFDRLGNKHKPKTDTVIRNRKGVWFVFVHDDKILFTQPDYAPLVPELPGGGIDKGETIIEAAYRELYEETELKASSLTVEKTHKQFVHFYAEHDLECWNYDQTFFLVTKGIEHLYFKEKRKVTEGHCEWLKLGDQHKHKIHYMHKKALEAFDLINM